MNGLSARDRFALVAAVHERNMPGQPHPTDDPKCERPCEAVVDAIAPYIEQIVTNAVAAALTEAADAILRGAPQYGHEPRERLKGRHEAARLVRDRIPT